MMSIALHQSLTSNLDQVPSSSRFKYLAEQKENYEHCAIPFEPLCYKSNYDKLSKIVSITGMTLLTLPPTAFTPTALIGRQLSLNLLINRNVTSSLHRL